MAEKIEYTDDLTDEVIEGRPNRLEVTMSSGQRKTIHLTDESFEEVLQGSEQLSGLILSDD